MNAKLRQQWFRPSHDNEVIKNRMIVAFYEFLSDCSPIFSVKGQSLNWQSLPYSTTGLTKEFSLSLKISVSRQVYLDILYDNGFVEFQGSDILIRNPYLEFD